MVRALTMRDLAGKMMGGVGFGNSVPAEAANGAHEVTVNGSQCTSLEVPFSIAVFYMMMLAIEVINELRS